MPGMLETILNVGLDDVTLRGLLRTTGDPTFVWDSYRRFVQTYAEVVGGCPSEPFGAVIVEALARDRVPDVAELDVAALRVVVDRFLEVYRSLTGQSFPQDPMEHLRSAVESVLRSWSAPRAVDYRRLAKLDDRAGTAVVVQSMVFGNMGMESGSGVGFTRDPATGEDRLYVDFLLNAQGEDIVAGRHAAGDATVLIAGVPGLAHQLQHVREQLEALFHDVQDFEFTVENGVLWMLQTRDAKRTPLAALRIACDLVDEGLVDPSTAVERLAGYDLDAISTARLDTTATPIGCGLAAGNGVVSGRAALSVASARQLAAQNDRVVLLRRTATTDDIAALAVCAGLVTRVRRPDVARRGGGAPAGNRHRGRLSGAVDRCRTRARALRRARDRRGRARHRRRRPRSRLRGRAHDDRRASHCADRARTAWRASATNGDATTLTAPAS